MAEEEYEEKVDEEPEEELAKILQAKRPPSDENAEAMLEAAQYLHDEMAKEEDEIERLRERQNVRQQRRAVEMERLAELRRAEEVKRKEEEAEKRRIKEEAKELKRLEKEKKQREKEERAKNIGKKNFTVKKSETSSLDQYESSQEKTGEMAKTKEQLDEEKRVALSQRIVPLDISGMNTEALIAKAKELHEKLYKLESEKYDLDDRFKRQQYDMMELAERARQMNKGGKASAGAGEGGFDRLADKFPNVPPKVALCSKYDRQTDTRGFAERREMFKKEQENASSKAAPQENGAPEGPAEE